MHQCAIEISVWNELVHTSLISKMAQTKRSKPGAIIQARMKAFHSHYGSTAAMWKQRKT